MTESVSIPTPTYIPPHLRDRVSDFRREADGAVSFSHPDAFPGLSGEATRAKVSPDQFSRTFDLPTRFGALSKAINEQYAPLERAGVTSARRINDSIALNLRKALNWGTSTQGKAIGTAGLLAALGGGIGSYALDKYRGQDTSHGKALLLALLAGGLGAAGTAWGQGRHNRRESFLSKTASTEVAVALQRLLENDPSLSRQDRVRLLDALTRLNTTDMNQVYRLVRTSAGIGAGALVARFLGAKGLLPLLLGGILGGLVAGGDRPRRNAQGQLSIIDYL